MSETIDYHNLGAFDTLEEVYKLYSNGGSPGDYVTISGVVTYWDDSQRKWGNSAPLPSVGKTTNVNGDLAVGGDLSVSGQIENLDEHIKEILFSSIILSDSLRVPLLQSFDGNGNFGTASIASIIAYIASRIDVGTGGGGEVTLDHTHTNLDLLESLSMLSGYLMYNSVKINASYADKSGDFKEGSVGDSKYARKDIAEVSEKLHSYLEGISVTGDASFNGDVFLSNGIHFGSDAITTIINDINAILASGFTNDQLLTALRAKNEFLSKKTPDTAAEKITFKKGLVAYALPGQHGIIETDEESEEGEEDDGIEEIGAVMPVTIGELTNVSDDADTAVDDAILVKRGSEYIPYTGLFSMLSQMQDAIRALQGGGPSPISYTVFFGTASNQAITEAVIVANFDGRLTQSKGNIACELSGTKQSEDYVFIAFLAVWGDLSSINIVTGHNENIPQTNWFNSKQLITIGSSQYNLYVSKTPIDGTSSFISIF